MTASRNPAVYPWRRAIGWGGIAVLAVALLALAFLRLTAPPPATESAGELAPHAQTRQVRYGYTLRNTGNRVRSRLVLWTYAPIARTAHQQAEGLAVNVPYTLTEDALGNRILRLDIGSIPPFGTRLVELNAELAIGAAARAQPLEDAARYLRPEHQIEADHPDIVAIAGRFLDQPPVAKARSLYQWVLGNMVAGAYQRRSRGALDALKSRSGDCTEFAQLYVALARAAGIPARAMAGYRLRDAARLRADDLHNWAEVYLEQAWRVVDPHARRFLEDEADYLAMTILGRAGDHPLSGHRRFYSSDPKVSVAMN